MPIYEYECKVCKSKFDQLVRNMSEPAKVQCPECGSMRTAKSMSAFAVGAAAGKPSPCGNPDGCGDCCGGGGCGLE